ncbi:MAG: putative minor capsid protein [Candidatus Limiplasma sp.]|nr:putative minor capsid protein [Candidatus Limiplasma sp.]MEA5144921.1 putative minor capsid protein [Candidatus Limiplasma sp.]
MIPIPVSMLIHTATLQTAANDRDQNRTYTTVAALSRVRVEPSNKQILTDTGAQKQLSAILFYDVRNSAPEGTTFAVGQYVLWNGAEYRIETVELLLDKRKPHHYEVGLSG